MSLTIITIVVAKGETREGRGRVSESNSEKFPFANYSGNYFVDATVKKKNVEENANGGISIGRVRWNFNHYSLIAGSDDRAIEISSSWIFL